MEGKPGLTQLSGRWSAPTWSECPIKIEVIDVLFGNNERPVPEGQWKTTNKRRRLEEMLMTKEARLSIFGNKMLKVPETKTCFRNVYCLPISKKLGNEMDCRNKSYFPLGNDNFWNWIKDFKIIRITSQKKDRLCSYLGYLWLPNTDFFQVFFLPPTDKTIETIFFYRFGLKEVKLFVQARLRPFQLSWEFKHKKGYTCLSKKIARKSTTDLTYFSEIAIQLFENFFVLRGN